MKRVLVTGGSRGLGLALCRSLLDDGNEVVTASRHRTPELGELAGRYPRRLEHHVTDFGSAGAVAQLVERARLLDGIDGNRRDEISVPLFLAADGLGVGVTGNGDTSGAAVSAASGEEFGLAAGVGAPRLGGTGRLEGYGRHAVLCRLRPCPRQCVLVIHPHRSISVAPFSGFLLK